MDEPVFATKSDHEVVQGSAPDPGECQASADVGKIHRDEERDVWHECIFDSRRSAYTWTIVPPVE